MALIQAINVPYPIPALIAAAVALVSAVVLIRRRRKTGARAAAMLIAASALMALAAGGLRIATTEESRVMVLVDESASTRGARYHDDAMLLRRIHELLNGLPYEIARFTDHDGVTEVPALGAGPTLLFSDGQFEVPEVVGPVYPVLDPNLDSPEDARVADIRVERGNAIAILENTGRLRQVVLDGRTIDLPAGRYRFDLGSAEVGHAAEVKGQDLWPENDAASLAPQPPANLELWNAGMPAMPGFREVSPDELPDSAGGYLPCALLGLDAAVVDRLSAAQENAILQYVQDLGGSLLLAGGDPRWANLRGSELERLSPLSIDPPLPQAQWIILLDASGSMAQNEGSLSKWEQALLSARALIQGVPERDGVQLGSFAQDVRWWSSGPAGTMEISPPQGLMPHGPTNLMPAIAAVMGSGNAGRRELLLLTDAEVEIPDAAGLAARMRSAGIRVSCLVLADGRGKSALASLCGGSGGRILVEANPRRWVEASRQLAGDVAPSRWRDDVIQATMSWPLQGAQVRVAGWNQTWLRQGATAAAIGGQETLAAWWRNGVGQVTAMSWWQGAQAAAEVAGNTQCKATADAYRVTWPTCEPYVVEVRAPEKATLRFAPFGDTPVETRMELVAPDRHQATISRGWRGGYATILVGSEVIAREVLAAGYEPEYAHVGPNRKNLEDLCARSGGHIVEAEERSQLSIRLPMHWTSLSTGCGAVALGLLAISVVVLRRRI